MIGVKFMSRLDISTFKGFSNFTVVSQDEKSGLYRCKPDIVGYQKANSTAYLPSLLYFTEKEIKSKL